MEMSWSNVITPGHYFYRRLSVKEKSVRFLHRIH